jgi:hypothetical protein
MHEEYITEVALGAFYCIVLLQALCFQARYVLSLEVASDQ